jgi:hypothetical protein
LEKWPAKSMKEKGRGGHPSLDRAVADCRSIQSPPPNLFRHAPSWREMVFGRKLRNHRRIVFPKQRNINPSTNDWLYDCCDVSEGYKIKRNRCSVTVIAKFQYAVFCRVNNKCQASICKKVFLARRALEIPIRFDIDARVLAARCSGVDRGR